MVGGIQAAELGRTPTLLEIQKRKKRRKVAGSKSEKWKKMMLKGENSTKFQISTYLFHLSP
jgi:hypothetical protein